MTMSVLKGYAVFRCFFSYFIGLDMEYEVIIQQFCRAKGYCKAAGVGCSAGSLLSLGGLYHLFIQAVSQSAHVLIR